MANRIVLLRLAGATALVLALSLAAVVSAQPSPNAGWREAGAGSASGGGVSNSPGASDRAALAVAPGGALYLAWADDSDGDFEIYVRRWSGGAWAEVGNGSASGGGVSDNGDDSRFPALAVAPDGSVYVAWQDGDAGAGEIYVRRWDGANWVEVGNGSASGGGVSGNAGDSARPSLAADGNGLILAWEDAATGDYEIYVRRWDGSSWVELGSSASGGGISDNAGDSLRPHTAFDRDGRPVVVWQDDSAGDSEIYARRWGGVTWSPLGDGAASGGGVSNNAGQSRGSSLERAPNGDLFLAWSDNSGSGNSGGNYEIYVRRWNGSAWVEVGGGSASGGGVSNDRGNSFAPALAVFGDGAPIVVWHDVPGGDSEIFARRWNGSSWVEIGVGSASGGGVSDNSAGSDFPALAVSGDVAYAAWNDDSDDSQQIYVRRSPATPECHALTLGHSGRGDDPVALPESSPGCDRGSYVAGEAVALTANPDPGWQVGGWEGTDDDGSTAAVNSLTMPAADHAVSVNYVEAPPDCFDLSLDHRGQGADPVAAPAASPGCEEGSYLAGETISLTAAPDPGWQVGGWEGTDDDGSTAAVNSLTMPAADHPVRVIYVETPPDCYALSLTHSGRGADPVAAPAASPGCDRGRYVAGEAIALTAEPEDGWTVGGWDGTNDDSSTTATNSLTMPAADHGASVAYVRAGPTCRALILAHGGAGADPAASPVSSGDCEAGRYLAGTRISLTAAPDPGWVVVGWDGTDDDDSAATTNSLTMPDADHLVIVVYAEEAPECYPLILSHTGSGADPTASPAASPGCETALYTAGTRIALSAAPDPGWRVTGWSGTANDQSIAAANSLEMPAAAHLVTVRYEVAPPACYRLLLGHSGSGADPVAEPDAGPGCNAGRYRAGTAISLTAAPSPGWQVGGWAGSDDDAATTATNTITMPAADHVALVIYQAGPGGNLIFIPAGFRTD